MKVIFTLDGLNTSIQCSKEEKIGDLCKKYSNQIGIDIDSLLFIYKGKKINFESSFNTQINSNDKENNEMKILVYKNENCLLTCPKCGEKIKLKNEKINDIIICNKEINNFIEQIKSQIDNMIKNYSSNALNSVLNNINKILNKINENIAKNNENFIYLINNNYIDNNNINSNTNKDNNNKATITDDGSSIKLNKNNKTSSLNIFN